IGGDKALMDYLRTINYPRYARENDMQGTTYIEFVIAENGEVINVRTARSAGHGILDTAAMDLIKAMKPWKPGTEKGKPVKVMYVVPLKFILNDGGSTIYPNKERDEPRKPKRSPKRN